MTERLQILMAEDSPEDAELLARALQRAGFQFDYKVVDTEAAYVSHLHPGLDVILSDHNMPQFSGLRALEILHERGLAIPFIIVSGTIGEEVAVSAMKQGAADYLLKDRLGRLAPAVTQAIEQNRQRQESKETEQALQESEERFREVVQNIEEVFWMTDVEKTEVLFISAAYEKIWGRTCASLYANPRTWIEAIHPDDRERVQHAARTRQADGSYREEYRIIRPDGSIRWISDRSSAVRSADGAVQRITGVAEDITEHRAAQDEVQKRLQVERHLSMLAATAPGIIYAYRLRPDGSSFFPYASPQLAEMLDIDPVTVASDARAAFHRVLPEDLVPLAASIRESAERLTVWEHAFRVAHPRAGVIWIEGRSVPAREEDGSTLWHGFLLDVTERKRAEELLREQAAMLDRTQDAIIVRGFNDRKITFWSKGAETAYGWTVAEATGKDIGELVSVDPRGPDEIHDILLTNAEWRGETRHKTRSGKVLIVNVRATLVRDADGQPKSVLSISTDITEQKNLEAQFLRAQRMEGIGTLASGVAHDLNNILAPIMMSAPLLRCDLRPAQREEIINTIEASASRGARIVQQVLTYGRGLDGERCPLEVEAAVDEILKIVRETFPKDIFVESSLPPNLWSIVGDATQIHQVLLNLCVNARDAMPEGGQLSISARNLDLDPTFASMLPGSTPGAHVMIQVRDSGSGIPLEIQERIFDPFFTTKDVGKGTGLGLSTVLGIVKSHGGHIDLKSDPGEGTTFRIYLPASRRMEPRAGGGETITGAPRGRGECVLVVDDEEELRRTTQLVLEANGYNVRLAADGTEALAAFAQNPMGIDIVLTDLMMPYMDGVALIHALKKIHPGTPIIASTGLGKKAELAELRELGIETVLKKPYGAETVLKMIHETLLKAAVNQPVRERRGGQLATPV